MADVIIKGMEMPRCCGICPCFRAETPMHCQATKADKAKRITTPYATGRPDWCPLRPAPEWISVEHPPKVGERVILRAGVFVGEGYYTSAHTWWRVTGVPMRDLTEQPVTHWMPAPGATGHIGGGNKMVEPPGEDHNET